jgi:hypothetical protein
MGKRKPKRGGGKRAPHAASTATDDRRVGCSGGGSSGGVGGGAPQPEPQQPAAGMQPTEPAMGVPGGEVGGLPSVASPATAEPAADAVTLARRQRRYRVLHRAFVRADVELSSARVGTVEVGEELIELDASER